MIRRQGKMRFEVMMRNRFPHKDRELRLPCQRRVSLRSHRKVWRGSQMKPQLASYAEWLLRH